MKIGIVHDIHDPEAFLERGEPMLSPENIPENVQVRQFCPAEDGSVATCVWEAESVAEVSEVVDTTLDDASTQTYFTISEEGGFSVP
ncbi:hypothetical protein BG842_03325 [Haladaptatus sp. W1]|uniref:hypothetical protein n=1 Tax=Haladaptatus sp. W1 TaxID=1897478 RepID=UPI0008499284|nr:hypothetical protein [Haladaptatus sp. W1]ODR79838.1 hypothetical protein BG842_03325 [Haladaptatus sp. W1]